ncbi:MAG: Ig-like domain-containing protein [Oscillospiraceae bacterium]|nr:Ig-like domain-containing protein [Oscillospiraceae bacterium]MBQ9984845.1 Ig-like domain-containing protein [Oscillospiraceae bacterium]
MKKILSIILATAMLISLMPAVFAADTEAETGIKVVYDFTNELISENKMTSYQYISKGESKTGYKMQGTTLNYDSTSGFWEYMCNSNDDDQLQTTASYIRPYPAGNCLRATVYGRAHIETEKAAWIAFSIYVPKTGVYDLDIKVNYRNKTQPYVSAYIFKSASVSSVDGKLIDQVKAGLTELNVLSTGKVDTTSGNEETLSLGEDVKLDEGEHYFVYNPISPLEDFGVSSYMDLLSLTLTEDGTGEALVPIISSLTATENEGVTTVEAKAMLMSDAVTSVEDATITYSVAADDEALASVDESTGVVTGLADGTATIIATATKDGLSSSKSIEVAVTAPAAEPEEDEALTEAFKPEGSDVTAYAPSVDAVTTVTGTSATAQTDGSYKMVAPETDGNGNEFLYWAKGLSLNKRIVSLEREFTYTPAGGDRNYLIPVYAPESATGNEYYNANGQLIDCAAKAPALPSMAGYGKASEWVQYEDTNIYVAEYDNKTQPDAVEVTVNGTKNTVPYGTDVICTAADKDTDNKPFKCWTKSGINGKEEIVSCDKSYTFKAWETCTVTAIYEEHTYTGAKMKIIIDSFTAGEETGVMAEFIGFGSNVVEKGIMFGTQKIAMTKHGAQFTVTADKNGTYKGYAIVKNTDNSYTLITDGSYEHTK